MLKQKIVRIRQDGWPQKNEKGSYVSGWLTSAGTWSTDRVRAKTFKTQDSAEAFALAQGLTDKQYGLF